MIKESSPICSGQRNPAKQGLERWRFRKWVCSCPFSRGILLLIPRAELWSPCIKPLPLPHKCWWAVQHMSSFLSSYAGLGSTKTMISLLQQVQNYLFLRSSVWRWKKYQEQPGHSIEQEQRRWGWPQQWRDKTASNAFIWGFLHLLCVLLWNCKS